MNAHAARAIDSDVAILLREDRDGICVLTLNRPAQRNSLSEAMIAQLHGALIDVADDASVRAVVIAANGSAFCAGHDLKEVTEHRRDDDRGRAYFSGLMDACCAMMQTITQLPQPVVAAVQGIATAAGCQLVATCDLAIASDKAAFATPGVDIGLFCSTPMVALSRNVPRKQTMHMLLTGEPLPAHEARAMGLVNDVVPSGQELDAAIALARKVARKSSHVLKLGKQAFYRQLEMSVADAYRYTSEVMVENMMAQDAAEGIGAFVEKREPVWKDQ